jgi:hypothetical protein
MKKFNELINEKKQHERFTIKDLIGFLNTLDPNSLVGKIGHYGEFYPMDEMDFSYSSCHVNLTYNASIDDKLSSPSEKVLGINTPDIGEEPC